MNPIARRRSLPAAAALVVVSAVGVAACGTATQASTPPQSLHGGVASLENGKAATFTVHLITDPAALTKLDESTTPSDANPRTEAAMKEVYGGSVVLAEAVSKGNLGAPASQAATSTSVTVNGAGSPNLVQLTGVGGVTYARADVAKFESLAGADATQFNAFVAQLPAADSFVRDAVAGRWIKLPLKDIQDAASSLGGSAVSTPTVNPSQVKALQGEIVSTLEKDVTVTRASMTGKTDHLILTGSTRRVGTDLLSAVTPTLRSLPGVGSKLPELSPSKIQDRQVTVGAAVTGGKLSQLTVDLRQFLQPKDRTKLGGTPLSLVVDIADHASVSAPATSTAVTAGQLFGLFARLGEMDGASGTSGT